MAEDPFAVLGVDEGVTTKKVESAFRRLALRCHPDRHPKDPLAKARFLRLSRAKEVLLDPVKRRAAESHRRSRVQNQHQKPFKSSQAATAKRRAASEAAERRRRAAAEQLRKREEEAAARRRQAKEAAEAKRRCDELHAKKEEEARELAAQRERRKAELFDAFLRKKHVKATPAESDVGQSTLEALVQRFASSSEHRLRVPGPLSAMQLAELRAAVAKHGLSAAEDGGAFDVQRPRERSESESPWGPPEGTRADKKAKRTRKRTARSSLGASRNDDAAERQRKALERLQVRRRNGEGLTTTPQGSWWVHDAEAERWAKYIDYCGF